MDLSVIYAPVEYPEVILGVMAIAGAAAGLLVTILGAKLLLSVVQGGDDEFVDDDELDEDGGWR